MSIGAYIGYAGQKQEFNLGFDEIKYSYYRFGGVFTYELNDWLSQMNIAPENGIEMYASAKAGLNLENRKSTNVIVDAGYNQNISSNKSNEILLDLGVVLGARYHFTNQFGLFCEAGWANAGFFTLGTSFTL